MPVTSALRSSRLPWIVSAVAGAIAVALLVILLAVILPDRHDARREGIKIFTGDEQAALNAARVEAVNVSSYRRSDFEADVNRALAGATGDLKADLQARSGDMKTQLDTEKIDISGQIVASALQESADGKVAVMLVLNGTARNDAGQSANTGVQRITLTMTKVSGKWLAESLDGAILGQSSPSGTPSPSSSASPSGSASASPSVTPSVSPSVSPSGTGASK